MGENKFTVSIDKTYKSRAQDIMKTDPTYVNQLNGEPNYKKVCEKAIDILHLLKTGKLKFLVVGKASHDATESEIEYIKKLLDGGVNVSDS